MAGNFVRRGPVHGQPSKLRRSMVLVESNVPRALWLAGLQARERPWARVREERKHSVCPRPGGARWDGRRPWHRCSPNRGPARTAPAGAGGSNVVFKEISRVGRSSVASSDK